MLLKNRENGTTAQAAHLGGRQTKPLNKGIARCFLHFVAATCGRALPPRKLQHDEAASHAPSPMAYCAAEKRESTVFCSEATVHRYVQTVQ